MKLTKNQKQEIRFYKEKLGAVFTEKEVEDFINFTVKGKGKLERDNPLLVCKRNIEISEKMWLEDLQKGLLFWSELYYDEEFGCSYWRKITKSIIKQAFMGFFPKVDIFGFKPKKICH